MPRCVALSCPAVTLLIAITLAGGTSPAAVKVQPAEVSETRMATLIKKENVFTSDVSRLQVKLNVDGPEIKGSTKWGSVKLTEAVDDVGTDLKPKDDTISFGPGADEFEDISRFGFGDEKKSDAFDVTINLALPARKATAIKSLKGEFQVLAGGEEKVATFTKLKTLQGKPLEDASLESAGIKAQVIKPAGDDPALAIEYTGKTDAIKDIEIIDATGNSVSQGHFSNGSDDKQSVSYMLSKPLDDGMTMKIHLVVGQKAVTVPFELNDVKLP